MGASQKIWLSVSGAGASIPLRFRADSEVTAAAMYWILYRAAGTENCGFRRRRRR
jgi:hypothetical protein